MRSSDFSDGRVSRAIATGNWIRRIPGFERIAFVLLAGLALGSSAVMTRLGVSEIPPLPLVLYRLSLASLLFLFTLLVFRRPLPRDRRTWVDILIVGFTSTGIPMLAFTFAVQFISSGVLTIFLAMIPLLTSLIAHVWLSQEKLNLTRLAGLLLAFFGVSLLLVTGTTGLAASEAGAGLRGHLMALGGVVVTAVGVVYTRRRLREVDVLVVTAGQLGAGLLLVIPLALSFSTPELAGISWRGWLAVTYTGVIGTYAGFLLLFLMIKRFGATIAALPGYVVPAVAMLLGSLLLGEIVSLQLGAGALLVLLGVFWASR